MYSFNTQAQNKQYRNLSFDSDWRFTKDSVAGAEKPAFNDFKWRVLDLPHDWSIEDVKQNKAGINIGPFSKESAGDASTGHTVGGTGWYRKTFTLNNDYKGKRISIYFQGAYMETDVWVNGYHAGDHKYGYTSFYFDITKYCRVGKPNVIAVRVVNYGKNSRWYSGSGIYRHVQLIATDPVHIAQWGVYVTTPTVSSQSATVAIKTKILNETGKKTYISVETALLDKFGRTVGISAYNTLAEPDSSIDIPQTITIKAPKLWSLQSPNLYKARISVSVAGKVKDVLVTPFGIRKLSFSVDRGFLLNDQPVKLYGGCVHHDDGVLGSATIDRAEERKIELLKANGFNAVRCSHNPPSEKFLETCDKLGILVIDESFDQWEQGKNPDDYHRFFDSCWRKDFSSMILRDRNHPSVILWSVGNEIPERAEPSGLKIVNEFKKVLQQLDPSRLITEAINASWEHPDNQWGYTAPAFALLGVGGYNYGYQQYEGDHKKYPERIMMGTESVPKEAAQNWNLIQKHPYIIGDFVWTAMDYIGESGIGHSICTKGKNPFLMPWPWFNSYCGDIDLIGDKKPQSYYRDVVWKRTKITMAVHAPMPDSCYEQVSYWGWPDEMLSWNWPGNEGKKMSVNVYSRAPEVRLLLNGKIIGDKKTDSLFTAKFELPYAPGELKAVAIDGNKEVGQFSLITTGKPVQIQLIADRSKISASRNDLCYVKVVVTDDKKRVVPNANIPIFFRISGKGDLAGTGSADPSDMESFQRPQHNTFRGKCLVVLRPKGTAGYITLEATSPGLQTAKIVVQVK
jgi:beta-galactosidase